MNSFSCRSCRPPFFAQYLAKFVRLSRPASPRRHFTTSPRHALRTSELTPSALASLKANPSRLWSDIHATARWTAPVPGVGPAAPLDRAGLSRLTLTEHDGRARDWFVSTTRALGCTVTVDAMGNVFAVRPGGDSHLPATFAGSHLDSQPAGGRFDGVLGVLAGVEMLRVLNESWIETEAPVGVVNWTNEEGARFGVSMMGSGVWSGRVPLDKAYGVESVSGGAGTVKGELEKIGYLGDVPCHWQDGMRMAGHFELHIEQGPKLEATGGKIGVVQGVQAYKWFAVRVRGREGHAGATGWDQRADALLHATQLVSGCTEIAKEGGGLATVGIFNVSPGSVNTIVGEVNMTLDVRHPTDEGLEKIIRRLSALLGQETADFHVEMEKTFENKATFFHEEAIACVDEAARHVLGEGAEGKMLRMISGAGHDSVGTSDHCPTAMIFVPCRDGVSHNPAEWCEEEDCALGADVLLQSVLRFDQARAKTGR